MATLHSALILGALLAFALATGGCRPQRVADAGASTSVDAGAHGAAANVESCVNAWLASRGFDEYGHPAGTLYAGGTPLFDERTGESRDRLEYVFARHPEARAACVSR